MSKHFAPDAALSPKFTAGAAVFGGLVVVQAVLAAVTPDMFAWAGQYSALFYAAVTGAATVVAVYLKGDPLRAVGGAAVQAGETPAGLPHPDAVPSDDEAADTASAEALLARVRTGSTVGGAR